jgi:hypothetical protein
MNERNRPIVELGGAPGGGAGLFDEQDGAGGLATVSSGPYLEELPVGNMSVGEIRRRFRDRFDIDPQAQAVLDGNLVDDETRVGAGQSLMFTRRAGEKGAARRLRRAVDATRK